VTHDSWRSFRAALIVTSVVQLVAERALRRFGARGSSAQAAEAQRRHEAAASGGGVGVCGSIGVGGSSGAAAARKRWPALDRTHDGFTVARWTARQRRTIHPARPRRSPIDDYCNGRGRRSHRGRDFDNTAPPTRPTAPTTSLWWAVWHRDPTNMVDDNCTVYRRGVPTATGPWHDADDFANASGLCTTASFPGDERYPSRWATRGRAPADEVRRRASRHGRAPRLIISRRAGAR